MVHLSRPLLSSYPPIIVVVVVVIADGFRRSRFQRVLL